MLFNSNLNLTRSSSPCKANIWKTQCYAKLLFETKPHVAKLYSFPKIPNLTNYLATHFSSPNQMVNYNEPNNMKISDEFVPNADVFFKLCPPIARFF